MSRWQNNLPAMMTQKADKRSQDEDQIAQLKQHIVEFNDWQKGGGLAQLLDERIVVFLAEHGKMPGEDGLGDDDVEDEQVWIFFDLYWLVLMELVLY